MSVMSGSSALDASSVVAANRLYRLDDDRLAALLSYASRFSGSEAAQGLASRFHTLFFHTDTLAEKAQELWRVESAALGQDAPAMAALIVLSGGAHAEAFYREHGLPEQVLLDSLKDLSIWMDDHQEKTGRVGMAEEAWLLRSLRGEVIRLGRLQFERKPLEENILALRRRSDGMAALFFPKSVELRGDGQANGTNGIFDPEPWHSRFEEDETFFIGTPVHPEGYCLNRSVRLKKSEWELAAQPGCASLAVHIPKDGRMDPDSCRASLMEALRFHAEHFPGEQARLFTLDTWFLDAQLKQILPPDSNLVRFQKEFYCYPILSDGWFTYERVFGSRTVDIANAPEDSSLRRAVKHYVLSGGRMRFSAGVLLADDLPLFGAGHYHEDNARVIESLR